MGPMASRNGTTTAAASIGPQLPQSSTPSGTGCRLMKYKLRIAPGHNLSSVCDQTGDLKYYQIFLLFWGEKGASWLQCLFWGYSRYSPHGLVQKKKISQTTRCLRSSSTFNTICSSCHNIVFTIHAFMLRTAPPPSEHACSTRAWCKTPPKPYLPQPPPN